MTTTRRIATFNTGLMLIIKLSEFASKKHIGRPHRCIIEYQFMFRKPLVKDCDVQGEELCTTHYQSECWTQNIRKEVLKTIFKKIKLK